MTGDAGNRPRHVVVMGVSGSGKSTVAERLAEATGMVFAEADTFHSEANVAKMRAGQPLDDEDRWPWLESLAQWMAREGRAGHSTVLACSALRRSYRDVLRRASSVSFVHLDGPAALILDRMSSRKGHYMPASLLDSQLSTLEPLQPDEDGVVLSLVLPPDEIVEQALTWLRETT